MLHWLAAETALKGRDEVKVSNREMLGGGEVPALNISSATLYFVIKGLDERDLIRRRGGKGRAATVYAINWEWAPKPEDRAATVARAA